MSSICTWHICPAYVPGIDVQKNHPKIPSLLSAHAGISSLFSFREMCAPLARKHTFLQKHRKPHAWIREQLSKSAHLPEPTHAGTKYPVRGNPSLRYVTILYIYIYIVSTFFFFICPFASIPMSPLCMSFPICRPGYKPGTNLLSEIWRHGAAHSGGTPRFGSRSEGFPRCERYRASVSPKASLCRVCIQVCRWGKTYSGGTLE